MFLLFFSCIFSKMAELYLHTQDATLQRENTAAEFS